MTARTRRAALTGGTVLLLALTTAVPVSGAAMDDSGSKWTVPAFVVTPELLGISADGTGRAGVNSGGFIDREGKLRIIFATTATANGQASAVSSDGGKTFTIDQGFSWPADMKDALGHISITTTPTGGYRAFLRDITGIMSAVSKDGRVWTSEAGYRMTAAAMGLERIDGGAVVKLPSGRFRMYIGDESSYFRRCGSDTTVSTKIYSATSTDQVTWTPDPGYRVGPELGTRCNLHPHAYVSPNGKVTLVFHVNNDIGKSASEWMSSCHIAESKDGMSFTKVSRLPVNLPNGTPGAELACDDPDVVVMPDKSLRLFFSVMGPMPMGSRIAVASGRVKYTILCKKGSKSKKVFGFGPKCAKGWKQAKL